MSWIAPIYDRTQADVTNKVAKGYMNYTDLNRIEGDMEYLEGRFTDLLTELVAYGADIFVTVEGALLPTYTNYPRSEPLTFITDWARADVVNDSNSSNVGTNLVLLCNTNGMYENYYQVGGRILSRPSNLSLLTVTSLNDIENRLKIRYDATILLQAYYEALISAYYSQVVGGTMSTTNTDSIIGGTMSTVNTNTVSGGTF